MPTESANDPISELPNDAQLLKRHLRVKHDEVQLLKLMVDKLKLQLARRNRDQFGASSERLAQRCVRSMAERAYVISASSGVHSSNAIVMLALRACWICVENSGVKRCLLPSICV